VSRVGSRRGGLRGCRVAEEEGPVRNYAIGEEGWVAVTVSCASDSPGGTIILGLITLKLAVGQSCRRPHMGLLAGRVRCQAGWWAWESSAQPADGGDMVEGRYHSRDRAGGGMAQQARVIEQEPGVARGGGIARMRLRRVGTPVRSAWHIGLVAGRASMLAV
jgi:hypothetical protein